MKNIAKLCIPFLLILQSCGGGITKNESIDANVKAEMKALDDKLIQSVSENDVAILKEMMSDELLDKSGEQIAAVLKEVSEEITTTNYTKLDEYHIQNTSIGGGNNVSSGTSEDNDYTLRFMGLNKEMYVSLLIPEGKIDNYLITAVYGKYGDEWKLNILQFGQYRIDQKTAPEHYKASEEHYEKGHLIDAVTSISLANLCLQPANKIWSYNDAKKIKDHYKKVMAEINEKQPLPLTISQVESTPKVFRIFPRAVEDGYFPTVQYITTIAIGDTAAITAENERIHAVIGDVFPGINENKKYLFYRAFNEMPTGENEVQHFGFTKVLE